jgi:hypothetical protein
MTFKLTAPQLAQLKTLAGKTTPLTPAEAAQGYSWLFQWTSNAAGTAPAAGMDVAV